MRPSSPWSLLVAVAAASLVLASPLRAQADFIDHLSTTEDVGPAKVPSAGQSRIAVLTIEVAGFEPLDMDAVRDFFEPEAAPGQARFADYFERMSLGAYHPVAEVLDPVHFDACPLPEDYFGFEECFIPRNGGGSADAIESLEVGLSLLEQIFAELDARGEDFSRFDVNGPDGQPDGWIDGVLLIHNINFGGIALPVYFVRRDGPIVVDDTQINIVGIAESPFVALHEFGHLLGWADLYDESRKTQGFQYSAMGSWLYETPPPAIDAHSRAAIGWIQPQVVRQGESISDLRLAPAADSGQAVQLGEGQEYFILENRGAVSGDYIDGDIDQRGLAIYHVNLERQPNPRSGGWPLRLLNCLNCDPWAPYLMNEQADGRFDLQRSRGRRNDADDLFLPGDSFEPNTINFLPLDEDNPAFSSNRYDGAVTGVSVTNIRIDGDDILVDVRIDDPCGLISCSGAKVCMDGRCVEGDDQPDDQPDDDQPDDDQPDDQPPTAGGGGGGGGCSVAPSSAPLAWPALAMALLLGALFLRRRQTPRVTG